MPRAKYATWILVTGLLLAAPQAQSGEQNRSDDPLRSFSLVETISPAQERVRPGLNTITAADARACLSFLASDNLSGRMTASQGLRVAGEYAASLLALWGVAPAGDKLPGVEGAESGGRGYFQRIPMRESRGGESHLTAVRVAGTGKQERKFTAEVDFRYTPRRTETLHLPLVFGGYGVVEPDIGLDELAGLDMLGKAVLLLEGIPRPNDPDSALLQGERKEKYQPARRARRMGGDPKTRLAKERGAALVLLVEAQGDGLNFARGVLDSRKIDDTKPVIPPTDTRYSLLLADRPMPWDGLPTVRVSREMAVRLLELGGLQLQELQEGIETSMRSRSQSVEGVSVKLDTKVESALTECQNVLALWEGSDAELKKEVVVIGAHLDHLGENGPYIYNGADDNGSGSVGVLLAARAFAQNPVRPKRSILFALWTGEEQGLLGSRHYVANPLIPMEQTVVCLNLDMISRGWTREGLAQRSRAWGMSMPEEALKRIRPEEFLALSHAGVHVGEALRRNNAHVGLSLYLRQVEGAMAASGGSDHAPFAMRNVPWAFFFAAMHEDYHTPADHLERVDFALLEKSARLVYLTAFELADR